jgi:polar amino acid transport system substrate-binding protein
LGEESPTAARVRLWGPACPDSWCWFRLALLSSSLLLAGCEKTDDRYVRSVADVPDARIGVITGSTPAQLAYERFPDAEIQEYADFADTLGAIQAGHIDVTITAINNALLAARNNPDLEVIEDSLRDETTAVAIRKGNQELLDQVNAIIEAIKADGTLDDIDRRWLKREPGPYEEKDIPVHTEGKMLYVGVNATREPFSFMDKDGRITGHDGELARVIAHRLQRPLEFVNVRWDALIPALQSGKIDMVVTGMTANEERRKFVDFSEHYYMNKLVLLVRKPPAAGALGGDTPAPQSFWAGVARSFHSNIIFEDRYLMLLDGLKVTMVLSVLATLFGTVLGALVCFMRMSKRLWLQVPAKIYIAIIRGVPVLVLLMLIFYVIFASLKINPVLVAVIAFGLNFAAYVAEIFRVGIQSIDRGQTEAGISMGFSKVATFRHIILPQTIQRILPVYKGEFISMVKMTSIVGYVAVQDLTKVSDIIRSRTFDAFFPIVMVAVLYFLLAWLLIQALEYIERKTDPVRRRRAKVKP